MSPVAHDVTSLLDPFRARLRQTALLFDLDGTVAPIRPRPEEVGLSPAMRAAIGALPARAGFVAFVSGRALADLERIVAMPGCAFAGNHGMEIRGADGVVEVAESVRPHLDAVAAFARKVDEERLASAGTWLEDKGVTLSFHYRTAPDQLVARNFLDDEIAPRAEAAGLRVTHGRKVMEVRPPVEVNKGTAVRQLVSRSGCVRAVYFGDDVTDVDAWTALRELAGAGVLEAAAAVAVVGHETSDAVRHQADVTVNGVEEALDLVRWLADDPGHPGAGAT
jgi:trehalose 6-phosphate phosphatase